MNVHAEGERTCVDLYYVYMRVCVCVSEEGTGQDLGSCSAPLGKV